MPRHLDLGWIACGPCRLQCRALQAGADRIPLRVERRRPPADHAGLPSPAPGGARRGRIRLSSMMLHLIATWIRQLGCTVVQDAGGIELAHHRGARRISVRTGRQVPVQLPRPDPAPDRRAVDPEPPRQLRLRNALLEMLLLQHPGLPSVHPYPFPSVATSSPQRPGTSRSNKPKLLHFRLPQMLDLQLPPTPAAQSGR